MVVKQCAEWFGACWKSRFRSNKFGHVGKLRRRGLPIVAFLLALALCGAAPAWAGLGTSVTLVSGDPTDIYPGETTRLQITLSNNNEAAPISGVAFTTNLPGTLPNGLKIAGAASYSCTDPADSTTSPGTGTLTADLDTQTIGLAGGTIPARASSTDGTCTIIVPVTAGTSSGATATYTYTIASGAVTGNDGNPVANVGSVSQSINVRALTQPGISKSFGSSVLYLGGTATTMTVTVSNANPVPITNFSITDVFPQLSGAGIIKVAAVPNATASCNNGGSAPTFTPGAGDTTITGSGTIPARSGATNGSCTFTVSVDAAHTDSGYSTGARTNTINRLTQFSNDIGIPAAANATATVTVTSPLGVTKSFSPSSLASGQAGTMTITLSNAATSALTVTTFDDSPIDGVGNADGSRGLLVTGTGGTCETLYGGTTSIIPVNGNDRGVRLTGGTIPAGGSCTVTASFTATTQADNTPVTYTNTIAQGAVGVSTPGVVSQSRTATILVADTLRVLKTNNSSNPRPGNPVQYTITVQNWSSSVMNNVRIQETLPAGITYLTGVINGNNYTPTSSCSLTTANSTGDSSLTFTVDPLAARTGASTPGSCTVTFYAMVSTAAANGSTTVNTLAAGSVCADNGSGICNGGGATSNNSAVSTTVLSASKAFSPAGPLSEGTTTRMTITLTNNSANPLTDVSVSDTLPLAGSTQMQIANPANAVTTCGGSPTITAVAGSTSLAMNNATVPARGAAGGVIGAGTAGSCRVQVDVVAAAGTYTNTATVGANETYANGSTHPVTATATAGITYTSSLAATKSFSPASVSSGGRSTVTVRLANSGATALTNVGVSDPLPTGMVLAPSPSAYTTCAGSPVISASPGGDTLTLTGATLAGNGSCDLLFDVVATGSSNWTNTIPVGSITADGGVRNQTAVAATLAYAAPTSLTVAKATNPSTLTFPGQVSQLTITITNGSQTVSALGITDYFTVDGTSGAAANGMVVAANPSAVTTCPGGIVSATAGGSSVSLAGASLPATASCTISVNVTSSAVGGITNFIPTDAISTDQGLTNSGQATTSLTTQSNIGIVKQFTPNTVKPGERSRLRITFYNPTGLPMGNLAVIDTLPTGLTVPSGANPVTTCAGGTFSAPAADQIQLSGGTIAAASGGTAASCYGEIDVVAASQGDYVNVIAAGDLTATSGGSTVSNSQPTSDTLRVKSPLVVHKAIAGYTLDTGNPVGFTTGEANRTPGSAATLTIRLDNPNAAPLTAVAFTDTLPSGLTVATTPNASTTCTGGSVLATASATAIRLSGATVPAGGSCTVSVDVLSNVSGEYTNTIPAGAVTSFEGVSSEEPTSARLIVSTPPTVSKQFSPAVIPPNGTSTLTIVLGNENSSAITLTAALTDTLPTAPGAMVVAAVPNVSKTCPGVVTATAGSGTVTYASGAQIPAGGCTISVAVTGATAGVHTNTLVAGSLQTNLGNNQQPANATLTVSTLGFISGRVFQDNNVAPNGTFESGTDTPIAGNSVELRSGSGCSGGLVATTTTDVLGNYLFAGLAAGTYSVCQPVQPTGTVNGITTAGTITSVAGSSGAAGTAANPTATTSQIVGILLNAAGGGEVSGSTGNNFAEVVLSSISGTVFLDQNNNGEQNGVDTGIDGVVIDLLDSGGTVIATTTTDANGNYSFTNLEPGTYSIRQPSQPAGTSNGITTAGAVTNGGTPGTATAAVTTPSRINSVILPPNTAATGNNFAEIPNSRTLSGVVFLDYDDSGTLNGSDHGIGGQTINLTGTDVNGNAVSRTTTTASDGSYVFTDLPEGTYTVTQPDQPDGTTNGQTIAGSAGGSATTPAVTPSIISNISLTGATTVSAENNFAEIPGAAPDLGVAKTHTPNSLGAGSSTGYYSITISNHGTVATSGTVTAVDTLPVGITAAATPVGSGWSCSVAGQTVTCTTSTAIPAGGSAPVITLRVAVAAGLAGQVLTNTVTVSGGGEPPGFDGDNTASDPTPIAASAAVSGTVWRDTDHDRVLDGGEQLLSGWTVELLLNGTLVATTTTDGSGAYSFTNLPPAAGYQIRFREPSGGYIYGYAVPNEQGLPFSSGVVDPSANPAGAAASDGTLNSLTLLAGESYPQQSLPVDPSGVVYDAITRQPVAGAGVAISGPAGFDPAIHLVGGSGNQTQTTGTDGYYQFLLLPGAPSGAYTLTVTPPAGYVPGESTIIPATAGPYVPGSGIIQSQPTPPTGSQPTTYYFSFDLTSASPNIINNHIPVDPILSGALVVTKTTPLVNVVRGDLVPYTIRVRNTLSATVPNIILVDQLPPGFKYRSGSARMNGLPVAPTVDGRTLRWSGLTFTAGEEKVITLVLTVGTGVGDGVYTNYAWAINSITSDVVSNRGQAAVRIVPDPTFDCSDVLGKVFDDGNANGYQDDGEPGIANVRLATARGWLITTDAEGRFHVACAAIPQLDRGSNFIMKLDERTLPSGYRVTTENPRVVRLTRGKMSKINFGATIHRVVRVEVSDAAFEAGSDELLAEWAARFAGLPAHLKDKPSVLRLAYRWEGGGRQRAEQRLDHLADLIRKRWKEMQCCYPLAVETELVEVSR